MSTPIIRTPHAAIKIWNYDERITDKGAGNTTKLSSQIISTVSCVSIQTAKSKSDPVGTFNFVLAPTRNWVALLTPGSWCAIMMSNIPIEKEDFNHANASLVKMFGRIDTVRVEVTVDDTGARQTRYLVAGRDWGSVLNNILYIDPLVADSGNTDTGGQGNALYIEIIKYLLSEKNTPEMVTIAQNLNMLLSVFGKPLSVPQSERIAKPTHALAIPAEAASFFKFHDAAGVPGSKTDIAKLIKVETGALISSEGVYNADVKDGQGWINPFTLVGTHSLWSILMDNCNHALNELYADMRWKNGKPQLVLYSRIKPFSFQKEKVAGIDTQMRSMFQNVVTHKITKELIISVNAGTNWEDKFNFLEIKPEISDFFVLENYTKEKCQKYQKSNVFDREGFRPLIFSVKQYPIKLGEKDSDGTQQDQLTKWVSLMQEWYFDTHRLLNGKITMAGSTEYIPVGDNIMFDAEIIGVKHNYNSGAINKKSVNVLAHVETVQHNFSVGPDGARSYQTTIQFVRGIVVNDAKGLVGDGCLDGLSAKMTGLSLNDQNFVVKSSEDDPDGKK